MLYFILNLDVCLFDFFHLNFTKTNLNKSVPKAKVALFTHLTPEHFYMTLFISATQLMPVF